MPAVEAGDIELARRLARSNVEALLPHVREGKKILIADPTCSYMLRKEYAELVGTPEAKEIGQAAMDVCEYLFQLKQEGKFNRDFRSDAAQRRLPPALPLEGAEHRVPLARHAAADPGRHRQDGGAVLRPRRHLGHEEGILPAVELAGKKAFEEMAAVEADMLVTDCPLAAVQFEQALGTRPIHPIQVLSRAYRPDGFPKTESN